MSRYGFTPTTKAPGNTPADDNLSVIVGWDNPLQTLFGDVELDGHEMPLVSTMADMGQTNIYTVLDLEYLIGYRIPNDISLKLTEDMANRSEPSPLQKSISDRMKAIGAE